MHTYHTDSPDSKTLRLPDSLLGPGHKAKSLSSCMLTMLTPEDLRLSNYQILWYGLDTRARAHIDSSGSRTFRLPDSLLEPGQLVKSVSGCILTILTPPHHHHPQNLRLSVDLILC